MSVPPTWVTRPRYEFGEVATMKRIVSQGPNLTFAELDLDGRIVRFAVSGAESEGRVATLFTKEPGTIDWIHSFAPEAVFADVGANVGIYSVYAGVIARARVYAFEPESQNYAELCRSIFLNGAHGAIVAFCVAICDQPVEVSRLLLSSFATGASYHDFGEPSRPYPAAMRFAQGSIGFSLDHLVQSGAIEEPDHVKIDVDGHEDKVMAGMRALLGRGKIRTVLLECNPRLPHTADLIDWMFDHGWQVNEDQVRLTREGLRPTGLVMDEVRGGVYVGNVIFGRCGADLEFATRALERFTPVELERMRRPK